MSEKPHFPATDSDTVRSASKNKVHSSLSPEAIQKLYFKTAEEVTEYALLLLDVQGNILNWNPGAAAIKGYAAEEVIGKNFNIFYPADDRRDGLPENLLQKAQLEGKASHEGWRVKRDGTTFWGSIVITALHDEQENVIGFSKVTRDLTERKKFEERLEHYADELKHQNEMLRKSEERYHRMIAEVEDYAIILLDIDGNILNWNKGAEKIKGYKENEIRHRNFREFYLPQDRQELLPERLLAEAAANNKATHEGWRLRKDGSRFWGLIVITALHDDAGQVTGFSKVTRDLTKKKEADDLILMQNKQLEEYAYVASHDLQEPLRKISVFGNLLRQHIDERGSALAYLDKIDVSTQRMSALIKAVLDYSQALDNDGLKATVDLNEVIGIIRSDFEMLLSEKDGTILCGQLPSVPGIPIQMNQLFSNLIKNAIKFNDNPPVVSIFVKEQSENSVTIHITDNGIGISPEYSDKIFKMFNRLNDNTSGTGIGLALCKKIVENHGGSISVISQPGKGSTFEVILPL